MFGPLVGPLAPCAWDIHHIRLATGSYRQFLFYRHGYILGRDSSVGCLTLYYSVVSALAWAEATVREWTIDTYLVPTFLLFLF